MLTQLCIKNFGLIEELTLDFHKSLNILTGETGAGKSIIIDALRIGLGERIFSSQVRDRAKPVSIEAVFTVRYQETRTMPAINEYLDPEDDQLIIHRTYQPDGRNKIKLNGQNITVSQLKKIGNHLVDLHGPHDHQQLLSEDAHIDMLDRLIDFEHLLIAYQEEHSLFSLLKKEWAESQKVKNTRERELDFLSHQIREIEQIQLDNDYYLQLKESRQRLNNAEALLSQVQHILRLLDGHNNSCSENIRHSFSPFNQLVDLDTKTSSYKKSLEEMQNINEELVSDLQSYATSLSFDPASANEINEMCDLYDNILKKHGPEISNVKDAYMEAKHKFDLLNNWEQNDSDLQKKIQKIEKKLNTIARQITAKRQKTAQELKKTIVKELKELGIPHVNFEAKISPRDLNEKGADKVLFYISPNAGEELKPLAEIVSSGEAARVMLALKKALVLVDPIPTLIFDEIDAQIGGRLGKITGGKLKEIAQKRQVILITHLPQIASFADQHFKVIKKIKNKRSYTDVLTLDQTAIVKELAKMMSGEQESSIALEHAQDLLLQSKDK
ncbi:MAG: DNA repair protein RecN [Candidatus Omnitrophica bacterium]|nr:DNA repair protein RecN [Candidatus Omnitrophota bacterium]